MVSLLLCENLRHFWKDVSSDEGNDTHIKTSVGCALTCSQSQKEIVRFGPNKELNQTSNKNLGAQNPCFEPLSKLLFVALETASLKAKLGRAVLRSGSAQSFSMQHSDRIPGNHDAPWKKNVHHFQCSFPAPFNLTNLNPAKKDWWKAGSQQT